MTPRDAIAIIPCRNEATTIADVVRGVRRHLAHVLVVDDVSTDATAERAAAAGAEVLRLSGNLGKGAALRAGLRWAIERGFPRALTLDGDGQHRPDDIPRLFAMATSGEFRLIIGNRMHNAQSMPLPRRATNSMLSRTLSLATGQDLPDTQCGFRLLDLDPAFVERLTADHFETESDQIAIAMELGWEIAFTPVACVYHRESSAIRPLADGARWLRWFAGKRRIFAKVRSARALEFGLETPLPSPCLQEERTAASAQERAELA